MSSLRDARIAFIGSGVMAEAMVKGLLREGLGTGQQIIASDPLPERRELFASSYGTRVTSNNPSAVEDATIVVLSIKPQVLGTISTELKGFIPRQAFLVSILPGVRLATLAEGLDHARLVRVMPNTPAQIGQGMSVWTASAEVAQAQLGQARAMLATLGEEMYVAEERYLDMATALNGSGPAYFFLFLEALVDAGVGLGFARADAERLVLQTARGAVEFARSSPLHLAELRNIVTTPGGTTAAALEEFERGAFRAIVSGAIKAAYHRSLELGE